MWLQASSSLFKSHPGGESTLHFDYMEIEDVHAHSPVRHDVPKRSSRSNHMSSQNGQSVWPYRIFPTSLRYGANLSKELHFVPEDPALPDPFIEPFPRPGLSRRTRSTLEDVSMPDYISTSTSSRAFSSMTGLSYEHKRQTGPDAFAEEHLNHVMEAMSPVKLTVNTASNIPTIPARPSAAAKARSASYTKSRPSSLRSREASFPGTREVSGSSVKSGSAMENILDKGTPRKTLEPMEGVDANQAEKSYKIEISQDNSKV